MKQTTIPFHHLWISLAASMMVRSFYTFPRAAAIGTSTAAPWAILLAGGVTLLLFWPLAAVLAKRPGQNLIDLAVEVGGRPLAIGVALVLGALLIGGTGIGIRQASEMAVTGFYPHTPQTFAMVSLVLTACLGAALSPPSLIWIGAVSGPPTLGTLLLVLIGNLGWGRFRHIIPPTGPGLVPVMAQVLPLTSFFGELVYLAIISPYVRTPRRLMRAATWGLGLSTAVGAALVLVYLMVFPLPGGLSFPFPLLELTRLIQGGRYLERVDILWIWLWVVGSTGLAAGAIQSTALLITDAFRLPTHRGAVLPLAVATLSVALFPSNQATAIAIETFLVRRWGFIFTLLLPLAIALLARRRGRARHA